MTRPHAPRDAKQLPRDIARHLDRRRLRRKLLLWLTVLALAAAAVMYVRCGSGFGLGGTGQGIADLGQDDAPRVETGQRRCTIRIAAAPGGSAAEAAPATAAVITVDGKPMTRDQAVAACREASAVDIVSTGDARQRDLAELRAALESAGIKNISVR
jgi:hypothetical protein